MKHLSLFFLFAFCFSTSIFCQPSPGTSKGEFSGRVVDNETGKPLEFATISVFSTDSLLVNGGITSSNGNFSIELNRGKYYAVIQFISYESTTIDNIDISGADRVFNAGSIGLSAKAKELNEVNVTADKSEMVINLDKKVFNVGKDLSNTGKTALDILDNIPSIQVDLDGNVSLRGSENLQILIDGKPSGLVSAGKTDALQNLQGSMIERIEVVTNPSARYQAEGMAGIINIVLKKDQQKGVNGSFEATAGYPENYSLGANVNFRREKFNYFLNYNIRYHKNPGYGSSYQHFMRADTSYITRLDRERTRSGLSNQLRGGFDYFINPTNTLTASFLGSYEDQLNLTHTTYRDYTNEDILQYITPREDRESETERNFEASLNYEKNFGKDEHKLTALAQYEYDNDVENSSIFQSTSLLNETNPFDSLTQRSKNPEIEEDVLLQADYSYPFGSKGKFEAGYRSEYREIYNPYSVDSLNASGNWESLPGFTNDFKYTEYVHAMYLQAGNNFRNFSLQLGLRAEYSDVKTHLEQIDQKNHSTYLDFFPTVHSTYKFNDVNSVQISYSRRIHRPDFRFLNPFHTYSDARNIRTGNPFLKPEYTNSYEAGYLLKLSSVNLYAGAYYRGTKDVFTRITIDSSGINYFLPINLSTRKSFGVESNLTVNFGKWWTLSGDYNFYRSITEGTFHGESQNSDDYSWNVRLNSRMRFPHDIDLQTICFYRAPEETTQGLRKAFYMLNMAVSKDILKRKGTITLNVQDILDSRRFRYILDIPTEYSDNEFRWSKRSYSVTFIYRLNQKKKAGREGRNNGDFGGEDLDF